MRIAALILLAALAVAIPSAAQDDVDDPSHAPPRARRALTLTQKHRDAGDHAKAVEVLQKVVTDHPEHDHHLLRLHLALSLRALGRDAEAVDHLTAAADLEPRSRTVRLALAGAALAVEDYAAASDALLAAWELGPSDETDLLHDAAAARLLADDPPAAADLAARWLDVANAPTVEHLRTALAAALRAERPVLARRVADTASTARPDDPAAWSLAADALQSIDDLPGAAAALQSAHWLAPLTGVDLERLADLSFAVGVPLEAARHYEAAYGPTPPAADAERLASAWLAAHRPGAAVRVLQGAVQREPSHRLWSLLADAAWANADTITAVSACRSCLAIDPADDRARAMLRHLLPPVESDQTK